MKKALLCCCLIVSLLGTGCGRPAVSPRTVLEAICAAQNTLPAGQIYTNDALPGEAGYADNELLSVLYGDGALPIEFQFVTAYAIRLCGTAKPVEAAVFLCTSRADAYAVGEMCLRRLDLIRRTCRGTPEEAESQNGTVEVYGKYVLFVLCPRVEEGVEAAKRAIKG